MTHRPIHAHRRRLHKSARRRCGSGVRRAAPAVAALGVPGLWPRSHMAARTAQKPETSVSRKEAKRKRRAMRVGTVLRASWRRTSGAWVSCLQGAAVAAPGQTAVTDCSAYAKDSSQYRSCLNNVRSSEMGLARAAGGPLSGLRWPGQAPAPRAEASAGRFPNVA
jgi:hypothetical protein